MKNFTVNIWAYDYHGVFEVTSEDDPQSLENAILDKLGENSIKLELKWEQEHLDNNRYTLEMVRIDDKVREVITKIKLEEAAIAHRQNTIEGAAPQVSVAT